LGALVSLLIQAEYRQTRHDCLKKREVDNDPWNSIQQRSVDAEHLRHSSASGLHADQFADALGIPPNTLGIPPNTLRSWEQGESDRLVQLENRPELLNSLATGTAGNCD